MDRKLAGSKQTEQQADLQDSWEKRGVKNSQRSDSKISRVLDRNHSGVRRDILTGEAIGTFMGVREAWGHPAWGHQADDGGIWDSLSDQAQERLESTHLPMTVKGTAASWSPVSSAASQKVGPGSGSQSLLQTSVAWGAHKTQTLTQTQTKYNTLA